MLEEDVPITGRHLTRGVAGPQFAFRALPAGIHASTSGMDAANSCARLTREWNEMTRLQFVFPHRFRQPDLTRQVRASVTSTPSRVTSTPFFAHSRYVASSTPTMAT